MKYTFLNKNGTVTEALENQTRHKLDKISKFLPEDTKVDVTFDRTKLSHAVEVTIFLQKRVLRAEAVDVDTYTAIDKVLDKVERQLVKYKERLKTKSKKSDKYKDEYANSFTTEDLYDDFAIIKNKRFTIKPMDIEDAIMEMDLLSHSFFVFRNMKTDEINVVYKRKDNSYGLIETM